MKKKHIKLAPSERKFAEGEREWRNLLLAVVEQAVVDWRWLCQFGDTTEQAMRDGYPISFAELEQFFENDCEYYLHGTGICAPQIYRKLCEERADMYVRENRKIISILAAKSRHKRTAPGIRAVAVSVRKIDYKPIRHAEGQRYKARYIRQVNRAESTDRPDDRQAMRVSKSYRTEYPAHANTGAKSRIDRAVH